MPTPQPSNAPLWTKLQLKPGMRGAIIAAPDDFALGGDFVLARKGQNDLDFIIVFCRNAQAVRELAPEAVRRVRDDGLVWLCYPKAGNLGTDLTRDRGWEPVAALGWRPVRQVAIDAVWSGLRFRPKNIRAN